MHRRKLVLVLGAAFAIAAGSNRLVAQKGYDQFQKALAVEKGDGNLNDAIKLYQQAIKEAGTDRALAAKAWLHIGECYQKLGDKQAQVAFERVVREFSDVTVEVAEARARLGAISAVASVAGAAPRQIGSVKGGIDFVNGLMPDGRLAGTDWDTGDVIIRDTSGRMTQVIAGRGKAATWGEEPLVSPDLSQLAYAWYDPALPGYGSQLRLMMNQPGSPPRVLVNRRPDMHSPVPSAWSKDGKSILTTFKLGVPEGSLPSRGDIQLTWVSALDGSIRRIKALESWRSTTNNGCCIGPVRLSPDGRFVAYAVPPENGSRDRSIFVLDTANLSETEVVRGGFNDQPLWDPGGDMLIFVSSRGDSFGLWSIRMHDGRAAGLPVPVRLRIGNVSLQGINSSGMLFFTQSTGVGQVFIADLGPDGRLPAGRLNQVASLLGESPSWSPDGSLLALKRRRDDGSRDLVVWTAATGAQRSWSPPQSMGDRTPVWFPDGRIQPITNSTLRVHVDQGELKEERVTHTVPLGTISRDGKTMYVGEAASAGTPGGIVAYDAMTGDRRGRVALPQGAGSIALSPDGQSFAFTTRDDATDATQRVARVNLDGSDYRVLHTGNIGGSFAVWSADGTAILFAEDGERRVRLMRVQASGGAAEPVGIEAEGFFGFDVSPDGKHVAYGTIGGSTEIWTLDMSSSFKK